MSQSQQEHRAHFRLRYPEHERPSCRLGDRVHTVVELSEAGLRLHLDGDGHAWDGPAHIEGVLELADGAHRISGDFLRAADDEVVFQLSRGVDLRCMLNEQKRLVRKYPALFGKDED